MIIPALPFKVKTIVSWAGEEEGDLGFIENEIVEVFSIVDESWWNGKLRRNGAEGIFPKDYVEVIEEQMHYSSSSRSLSNSRQTQSRQNTPQKEEPEIRYGSSRGNNSQDSMGYQSKKLSYNSRDYNSRDASFNEEDYSNARANTSLDTIEFSKGSRSRNNDYFRKHKSSTHLNTSLQNSKNKINNDYQRYEDREREMEAFKQLQKQNSYQVKKGDQSKRYSLQAIDTSRGSLGYGESYHKFNSPKTKSPTTQKLPYPKQDIQSSRYSCGDSRANNSNENQKQQYRENNQSDKHFLSQDQSMRFQKENYYPQEDEYADELEVSFEEISKKRQQLEMELQYLKNLERSTQKKRMQNVKIHTNEVNNDMMKIASIESSYISEDLASSKKNYKSGDELGAKLNGYVTDEVDENVLDNLESGSPPPPPPKHTTPIKQYVNHNDQVSPSNKKSSPVTKVPYNAEDFKISGQSYNRPIYVSDEDALKISQIQQQHGLNSSIKSLQSDVLNLSELSATSAGSFLRHKYEKELRMSQLSISEEPANLDEELRFGRKDSGQSFMNSIYQDKKSRHPNIFKKFLQKKRPEDSLNGLERKIQDDSEVDWSTFKMELNRMNSLTSQDKQSRTKRVLKEAGPFIVKPLDYISDINSNDVLGDNDEISLEFNESLFRKVDSFIDNYNISCDLNDLISDISIKFNSSKICQLRCILIYICKFQILEEAEKISRAKPKVNEILLSGEATIFQLNYLFKKMLDALRIPSEVVLGFWKKPNEFYHSDQYVTNHAWLSILLDNQFLLLDLHCFKNGSICNIRDNPRGYNEFYFLTKPLNLVSTHIVSVTDLQHIVPPVDQNVCFYLPRAYSGFYKSSLKFNNFNNALTILKDLEFFELEIEIPIDIELFTLVKTSNVTTNELSLCQVQWINNKRIAKIKAILPNNESIGVLQIFAGPKGLQKHFDNIHELAIVIPIEHTGEYRTCKFVPRFPTFQSQNNDLYIKSPQTSKIISKNSYNFIILQHPSKGINSGSDLMNNDFKIVIESPSGKYFKLVDDNVSVPYGSFEANIKCQEVGLYRGLVIGDSGNSWYVFAQWECVPNVLNN